MLLIISMIPFKLLIFFFLQILPRDRHPCCSAIHFPLSGHVRDLHPLERAHGAQTQKRTSGINFQKSFLKQKIGVTGFEPATSRPPAERATKLRHTPEQKLL